MCQQLGELAVNLTRLLQQHSLYGPEHQLTISCRDQFMRSFEQTRAFSGEVCLVGSADPMLAEFTVDGVFVEPVSLAGCLRSALRDEFLSKLQGFFNAHRLVSLTLKSELDLADLAKFLDLVSVKVDQDDPTEQLRGLQHHRVPLSTALSEVGVFNVRAFCRDEVLAERDLPWRVKLALSRLGKNLKELPIYARATDKAIAEAKIQLLQEVIRPLRSGSLLRAFVLNCDLVTKQVKELDQLDAQSEILAVLTVQQHRFLSAQLIQEMIREAGESPPGAMEERRRVLRQSLGELCQELCEENVELLRQATKGKLVSISDLPADAQAVLEIGKITDTFLSNPELYIMALWSVTNTRTYRERAGNPALLVIELARRGEVDKACRIVEALRGLSSESRASCDESLQLLTKKHLALIGERLPYAALSVHLPRLPPETCARLLDMLGCFSSHAVPALISGLSRAPDEPARAGIYAALGGLGEEARAAVAAALDKATAPDDLRLLVTALGTIGLSASFDAVESKLGCEVLEVRQAVLAALVKLNPERAEPVLLRALDDPLPEIQLVALKGLCDMGCRAKPFEAFLDKTLSHKPRREISGIFRAVVRKDHEDALVASWRVQRQALIAVRGMLSSGTWARVRIEESLIHLLQAHVGLRLIRDSGERQLERRQLVSTVIAMLAQLGSQKGLPALEKARDFPEKEIQIQANRAIQTIQSRGASRG